MNVIIAIVIIAAIIGWVFVKIDELSGLGRNVRAGGPRHPHGKLVSVRNTDDIPETVPFGKRFASSLPFITSAALLALFLALNAVDVRIFGIPSSEMALVLSTTGITALIIVVEATFRAPEGKKTFWTFIYALVGAVALGLAASAPLSLVGLTGNASLTAYCITTIAAYMFGSALVVALLPDNVTFERTFEDGAKRSITVSTRSTAYAAYTAMMGETPKED